MQIFSLFFFMISLSIGATAIVLSLREYKVRKEKRNSAVIVFLASLNSILIARYLSYTFYGELFNFGMNENIVSMLNAVTLSSLFFSGPYLVHTFYPFYWSRRMNVFFFAEFLFFVLLNTSGLVPPMAAFTIGVFGALVTHGFYAVIYGFIGLLRFPKDFLRYTKEEGYSFTALVVFLLTIPMLMASDFTTIPLGFLSDQFTIFPLHIFLMNTGFLYTTMSSRKWVPKEILHHHLNHKGESVREPLEVKHLQLEDLAFAVEKYNLSPREMEVAHLLLRNASYKEIAEKLGISHVTVKSHVLKVYQKTCVNSKKEFSQTISQDLMVLR